MLLLLPSHPNYHPLHNLPGEVLAVVLLFYIEGVLHDFSDLHARQTSNILPEVYPWLTIRRICRYWRDVSLQYRFLNAYIMLTKPADVAEQIRRSGRYPLSIHTARHGGTLSPEDLLESCRIVFKESHRIQSVCLRYDALIHAALQSPDFATLDLPNVRSVTLQFVGGKRTVDQYADTPFRRMQLPGLESYSCDSSALPSLVTMLQDKPFQHTLRSLEIRRAWRWPPGNAYFEGNALAGIIGQFTLLERLSIDTEFDITPPSGSLARKAHLPCLRSLRLYDGSTPDATSIWLSRIICPATTHITIESTYEEFVDPEAISSAITRRFSGEGVLGYSPVRTPSFVELELDVAHRSSVEFKFWVTDQVCGTRSERQDPPDPIIRWLIFVGGGKERAYGIVPFLRTIVENLPLSRTFGLLLRDRSRRSGLHSLYTNIVEVLRPLRSVRVLYADGPRATEDVLEAMERPLLKDHIFPRLERLHLYENEKLGVSYAPLERIGQMILYRRAERHEIQELKLEVQRWRIRRAEDWRGEAFLLSPEVVRCLKSLTYAFMMPTESRDVKLRAELMMFTRKALVLRLSTIPHPKPPNSRS